jgi:ERF superfamily
MTTKSEGGGKVYKAILEVMRAMASEGIAKDRRNAQQGYNFRGIDDVYASLGAKLVAAGLVVLPRHESHTVVQRGETKSGSAVYSATVQATFRIVCVEDGSSVEVTFPGEANDSADKATNKAMSAAYKYFALQTFVIPTEGDNDADASHHEVKADTSAKAVAAPAGGDFEALSAEMAAAKTVEQLAAVAAKATTKPAKVREALRPVYQANFERICGNK